MEPVLVSCDGCGSAARITRPGVARDRSCPRCGTAIDVPPADPAPVPAAGGEAWADGFEFESDEAAPRDPVRLAAEVGLLLALFTSMLFRLGGGPDTRASDVSGVTLSATEPRFDHKVGPSVRPAEDETLWAAERVSESTATAAVPTRLVAFPSKVEKSRPSLPLREPSPSKAEPPQPPLANETAPGKAPAVEVEPEPRPEPRRIRVRMRSGRTVVARVHGEAEDDVHIMLPDGQLGIPDRPAYTDEPFQPATADEVAADLIDGPLARFKLHRTAHYLIAFQSTPEFAEESGRVLENLYKGLTEAFRKFDVPVHEAEFPLTAVIFRTEQDFRAHKTVDPEVQAYYEIYTNRISFYQTSERDEQSPEVAALRRPQTVAHEGTHQILANIGIQPRLAPWPPWLIEGLAEYCATPVTTRRGTNWAGLGMVNSLHLATIRDLDDPLSGQVAGSVRPEHIGRKPGMPLVEYLVRKTELTPTDYALSWAMTHYLARKRVGEFVPFLKSMSTLPPLEKRSPDDQLAAFRQAFGKDLVKLDREIGAYLLKLKVTNHLPYFSVLFEQRIGNGLVRRAAIVSQSPSMIRQWLETVQSPRGEPPLWQALPFPNRTPAQANAAQWLNGR